MAFRFLLLIPFVFCVINSDAQISSKLNSFQTSCGFAHFLEDDGDYRRAAGEFERCYAESLYLGVKNDSMQLMAAWNYRKANNLTQSNAALNKLQKENIELFNMALMLKLLNFYDTKNHKASNRIVYQAISTNNQNPYTKGLMKIKAANYIYLNDQENFEKTVREIPKSATSPLRSYNSAYNKNNYKSPFLSGTLSTIIPGTGKIYTGRTFDGIYSMVAISAAALQAYYSYQDKGFSSISFYVFGGIALYFYGGNIYGSVISAREYNYERRQEVAKDLDDYIHNEL